ncbi:hypothetical protein GJ744_001121 [Endocarpon pusillum]|uniref:Uncharacterized protein n=1 Tax=Endocarpon pusillum TaxID=364733 RepID=A0A8H7E236_9EURO|nr:hypothetical protein GJ744_001121 [Endocarpon pusillum]
MTMHSPGTCVFGSLDVAMPNAACALGHIEQQQHQQQQEQQQKVKVNERPGTI